MSDLHIPYQECVEVCMFIIMGRLYDKKYDSLNIEVIQEIEDLLDAYKTEEVFKDAVDSLFHEGFITGEDTKVWAGVLISNPLMTQAGREWYQEQRIQKGT